LTIELSDIEMLELIQHCIDTERLDDQSKLEQIKEILKGEIDS